MGREPGPRLILLDTHVWRWWIDRDPKLSEEHRTTIQGAVRDASGVAVSVFSCWEVGMLASKGRLRLSLPVNEWMQEALAPARIDVLDLTPAIALASSHLPGEIHGDPADRIIVATARAHDARLLTVDRKLLAYEHVRTEATP